MRIAEIDGARNPELLAAQTLAAMREGPDIIFQAAFLSPPFYGRADFLRRMSATWFRWSSFTQRSSQMFRHGQNWQ